MATLGVDCELILDGVGYFLKPGSYQMKQPRIRRTRLRADGGLSYVDLGPGKRIWSMTLLCLNDQRSYDGTPTGLTGQQYRDALRNSYQASTGGSVQYRDPLAGTFTVHIDTYTEVVQDLYIQQIPLALGVTAGLSYEVTIELLEG